ncbi:hypothetical protein RIF29_20338 [Crotalaria pallida]|uniref:DUF7870 domain-containing protein n=1 Tax=Crotalaria pallida TaxID=3830 RepID=A0AAN9F5F1_CROPI
MDSKGFNFHTLNGSIAKRAFFRALFLASAVSLVSLFHFLPSVDLASLTPKTYVDDCLSDTSHSRSENITLTPGSYLFQSRVLNTFWGSFDALSCSTHLNLTLGIVKQLMSKRFLTCEAKSLCLGQGSSVAVSAMQQLGFSSVSSVHKHSFFSIKQKKIVYELRYLDCSFDFVFSKDLDKVSVPTSLVFEVERILKPGGIGALLVGPADGSVSSLLRSSSVVHVDHVNELSLVVFKKRSESRRSLFYNLNPSKCASFTFTKPLIELMEPLVEETTPPFEYEKRISYFPKFVDFSTRKRLVYIDVGVGELLNANVTDWFLPFYPIDQKAFSVYFVHHNASIMLSHVKKPGVTFVYHPGLAGNMLDPLVVGEEEFDFLTWFKETVKYADFVVLKMNAGNVEMKHMVDLVESGAICSIDEMFLSCSDDGDGNGKSLIRKERCMDIYKGLRSSGVYVHQWWETKLHQGLSQVVNVQ